MPEMSRVGTNRRADLTRESAHATAVAAAAEAIAADAAADVAAEAATTAKAAVEVALLAAAKTASKAKHVALQAASAAAAASTVEQSTAPDQPTLRLPPSGHADAIDAESAALAVATAQVAAAAAAALAVAKIAVAVADAATAAAASAIEVATLVEAQLSCSAVAATVALASTIAQIAAPESPPWPAALDTCGNKASALECAQSWLWSSTLVGHGRGLALAGELDICTAPLLAGVFATRPADYYADGSFLLDLTELSFIDVRGMRALADIDAVVTGAGHQLRVAPAVSTFVARILRMAVLREWLPRYFVGPADAGNSPASTAAVELLTEY